MKIEQITYTFTINRKTPQRYCVVYVLDHTGHYLCHTATLRGSRLCTPKRVKKCGKKHARKFLNKNF